MPLPDIDREMVALLQPLAGGSAHIGTATPADLQAKMPFVQTYRFGGADTIFEDLPVVAVHVYAETRAVAYPLGAAIRNFLLDNQPHRTATAVLSEVRTVTGLYEVPVSDPNLRHWYMAFTLRARALVTA